MRRGFAELRRAGRVELPGRVGFVHAAIVIGDLRVVHRVGMAREVGAQRPVAWTTWVASGIATGTPKVLLARPPEPGEACRPTDGIGHAVSRRHPTPNWRRVAGIASISKETDL